MIWFPFGDLNNDSIAVLMYKRASSPCNLTDKSSEVQQHLTGGKLLLLVVQ